MFGWIFLGLLVSAIIGVLRYGDNELRVTLAILVTAYIGTFVNYIIGDKSWLEVEALTIAWDGMAFIFLLIIALRSDKFWPLWIASLQLLPLLTFAAAPFGQNLVSQALGVAQGLWAYFQLLILLLVTVNMQLELARTVKSLPD